MEYQNGDQCYDVGPLCLILTCFFVPSVADNSSGDPGSITTSWQFHYFIISTIMDPMLNAGFGMKTPSFPHGTN